MGIYTEQLKSECASRGLNYVGTRGNLSAECVCVGEAPGASEDSGGMPFIGSSGRELDNMLAEAGFNPYDLWFTNPYKVRPPNNELPRLKELGIDDSLYRKQFFEELYERKPKIIIACGSTPLGILCPQVAAKRGGDAKVSLWRGSLLSSDALNWPHYVLPVYHPEFIFREWAERQIAVLCLERAKEELAYYRANGSLNPLPERELIVQPSYDTVIQYLWHILGRSEPVSIDIEMIKATYPYTVSLAESAKRGISFSFWDYPTDQLVRIWRLFDEVVRTKRQIGQNYLGFDCHWLDWLGFSPDPFLVTDTMVRHHVLHPEFEHKLQFQTFQYTRQPYYKDEGKLWRPKEGKGPLMRYNCLDTTVTYEIHDRQDEELDERGLREFFLYEQRLGAHLHRVEKRGVATSPERIGKLRDFIHTQLGSECGAIAKITQRPVAPDKSHADDLAKQLGRKDIINLNSPKQIIDILKAAGLKIPKSRTTGKDTTGEEHLQKLFSSSGNPVLKHILDVREYNKILGTYVNTKLANNVLYSSYIVTGTVTGRRSSRANFLRLGTNLQNIPKHSKLGKMYRECLVARPGHIFVSCDQKGAENWIVEGYITDLGGNRKGLDELLQGINRHQKLASYLFSKPFAECHSDTPEYYMGKKTRHAASYDMYGKTMSLSFAKEGFFIPEKTCDFLLQRFHEAEPDLRRVYQKYVQDQLLKKHLLRNPFGRERIFFSLRPYGDNSTIFREAYSYIPQGTVGDNTGMAMVYVEEHDGNALIDTHDALTLEVPDRDDAIIGAIHLLEDAFDRVIHFPNGLELKIPVEFELGYDLRNTKKCDLSKDPGLKNTLPTLREQARVRQATISGVQLPSSVPALSVTPGLTV